LIGEVRDIGSDLKEVFMKRIEEHGYDDEEAVTNDHHNHQKPNRNEEKYSTKKNAVKKSKIKKNKKRRKTSVDHSNAAEDEDEDEGEHESSLLRRFVVDLDLPPAERWKGRDQRSQTTSTHPMRDQQV